jgi:hypothetical protein
VVIAAPSTEYVPVDALASVLRGIFISLLLITISVVAGEYTLSAYSTLTRSPTGIGTQTSAASLKY